MNWKKVRLGDYTEFINGGSWSQGEYSPSGIPVVKVTNLVDGSVDTSDLSFLSESSFHKYKRHQLKKNDLVITTVGSHPNQVSSAAGRAIIIPAKVEGFLLNQNTVCIRSVSATLDQKFLGYAGKSLPFQSYIKSIARGAANQVRIAIGLIKEFELPLPPFPIQQQIANILSAYDDLIEINQRRIKLLEEAARCRYKLMMEEAGAAISVKCIEDICDIKGGGTPSTKVPGYWHNGEVLWFTPTDLTKSNATVLLDSQKKISGDGLRNSSAKLFPAKTIMMTSRATIGFFGVINKPASTNQGFINILPNKEYFRYFLLFGLNERKDELIGIASGSTFLEVSKTNFRKLKVRVPNNKNLLEVFELNVQRYFDLEEKLLKQNALLRQARDILLPRLMNGEIDINSVAAPHTETEVLETM